MSFVSLPLLHGAYVEATLEAMTLNILLVSTSGSLTYLPLPGQHPSTVEAAAGPRAPPELPPPLWHLGEALADLGVGGGHLEQNLGAAACWPDAHPHDARWCPASHFQHDP